jgi:hypothetical protein
VQDTEAASAKTHCGNGHLLDEGNTFSYVKRGRTYRGCKLCRAAHNRHHYRAIRDGARPVGRNDPAITHCPHGHPYDEENTYVDPIGRRHCKECRRIRRRRAA